MSSSQAPVSRASRSNANEQGRLDRSAAHYHVVGIADMWISQRPAETLITYSLGSCVGLTLFDPVRRVGGMVHCMLPMAKLDKAKAESKPFMFVDRGVSLLLQGMFDRGAQRKDLVAKVAGGAKLLDAKGMFRIGERNYTVLRKILWKNDILIAGEDVGGTHARTMVLYMDTGQAAVRQVREETEL